MLDLRTVCCLVLLTAVTAWVTGKDQSSCPAAEKCDTKSCKLPDCFCSGNETIIGGDNSVTRKPQLVFLTFDDALSSEASKQFYEKLFGTPQEHPYSNPNGCAIRATHFLSHSYTDYSLVSKWWSEGHEMASHSITHRANTAYWKGMTEEEWVKEIVGQRKITAQFAAINPCEIKGMRAPFLQGGGDTMYSMLDNNNFRYDCSWPTRSYGYIDAMQGLYPYTLDYKTVQDCPVKPCPKCAHPGMWVQPMIDLEDEWIGANPMMPDSGQPCSMLDACVIIPHGSYVDQDPNQVYEMLIKNFNRTYLGDKDYFGDFLPGNRAPWGLYMHAAWFFGQQWHFEGYKRFIAEISSYPDVWIVPVGAGLDYMETLTDGHNLSNDDLIALGKAAGPFACQDIEDHSGKYRVKCGSPKACRFPKVNLPDDGIVNQERYMHICSYKADGTPQNCPEEDKYPWLETETVNSCGNNVPCADCQNPY